MASLPLPTKGSSQPCLPPPLSASSSVALFLQNGETFGFVVHGARYMSAWDMPQSRLPAKCLIALILISIKSKSDRSALTPLQARQPETGGELTRGGRRGRRLVAIAGKLQGRKRAYQRRHGQMKHERRGSFCRVSWWPMGLRVWVQDPFW
jgi:hypothetical protein